MNTTTRRRRRRESRPTKTASLLLLAAGIFVGVWLGWAFSVHYVLSHQQTLTNDPQHAQQSKKEAKLLENRNHPRASSPWEDLIGTLTSKRLNSIAQSMASDYQGADPFPHAVIDDLFPPSVLEGLLQEIPETIVGDNGCHPDHFKCNRAKPEDYQYHKSSINKEESLGPFTRQVILFMMSNVFLEFLKQLTGVRGLLADPTMGGGGVHLTAPGGKLDLHADFNAFPGPKLDRRVNVFLFLNPDWPDEYGGHLELWNADVSQCGQRIAPKLGRLVVFSTSDFSHHGHPKPLTAPPGRIRRSLALYYYTNGRPKSDCLNGVCPIYAPPEGEGHVQHIHSTLWKKPIGCSDCLDCPTKKT